MTPTTTCYMLKKNHTYVCVARIHVCVCVVFTHEGMKLAIYNIKLKKKPWQ
jgi:hypothetical protein